MMTERTDQQQQPGAVRAAVGTVETLEPGRGMDLIVAERILGWLRDHMTDDVQYDRWRLPDGGWETWAAIPRFSTEIGAAWTVVERMQARMHWHAPEMHADSMPDGTQGWCCGFGEKDPCSGAFAPTLPLAICLAAIKACGSAAEHEQARDVGDAS